MLGAGGFDQHAALGHTVGIVHVDLEQEAVELGFRQRVGAFMLDRVLGREHMEGARQVMPLAGNRSKPSCIACRSADCVRGEGG